MFNFTAPKYVTLIVPERTHQPRQQDTITVPIERAEFYTSRGYTVAN